LPRGDFQSSLQDWLAFEFVPGTEVPGYLHAVPKGTFQPKPTFAEVSSGIKTALRKLSRNPTPTGVGQLRPKHGLKMIVRAA
jgi:hypothetical protein